MWLDRPFQPRMELLIKSRGITENSCWLFEGILGDSVFWLHLMSGSNFSVLYEQFLFFFSISFIQNTSIKKDRRDKYCILEERDFEHGIPYILRKALYPTIHYDRTNTDRHTIQTEYIYVQYVHTYSTDRILLRNSKTSRECSIAELYILNLKSFCK